MTVWGVLLLLLVAAGPARADDLSLAAQSYLDKHYHGWTLCPVNRDAELYFKAAGWHGAPNFLSYDFDGDHVEDVAIQIRYPKGAVVEEADLVLIGQGNLREYILARRPADPVHRSLRFIRPVLYGENMTDVRGRPISFRQNGVELLTYQKEATAYFFDGDALRKIPTLRLQ